MKTRFFFVALIATILTLTSCTSVKQTAPVMAIAGNNITTDVKANIDYENVNKKLSANNRYKGLSNAESIALYRAKSAADADIVLEPQFETETKSYFFGIFKKTHVNVTGWGANIKSFEPSIIQNSVENYPSKYSL